jgi:outer membrane protein
MRERRRTRSTALILTALSLLLAPLAMASDDPYRTESLTPPDHRSRWIPANTVDPPTPELEAVPNSSEALTLAQLTDLALRNNPRTRQAWANARFEAAQYGIAKSALMPQVDLVLNASRARTISNTSGIATPEQNRYGPSVSLSYVLYDFGARQAEVEAQAYRVLAVNLTQNRVLQEVVFQVEQAYFRLLGVEQLVRTGNQVLKSVEATLDAARRRQQAGLATIGDVFRSETAVAQAILNLRRAEGEVAKARGQIAIACGVPVTTPLRIQPLPNQLAGAQMKETLESMLKKASASRPDMAAAESRVRAARAGVTAAASAGMPSVELRLEAARQYYTDERPFAHGNLIGFNVRIPLFDGWRDDYAVRRARAQVKQAEAARDLLYTQTELDVWQAYYDLQTATSGITATKALVQGATQSASVAAARYQLGVGGLLDLLTAQADETSALVQQIQSHLDWYTALARLNFALGASGHFGATP